MGKSKSPIQLRQRVRESGRTSLYLDIYVNGRRRCESLKLYLVSEESRADREHNKQTLALAETIRAQRLIELRNRRYSLNDEGVAYPTVVDYFVIVRERKDIRPTTAGVWNCTLNFLREYAPKTTLDKVDDKWVAGVCNYIAARVSNNSARTYIAKLNAMFRQAVADKILLHNPMLGVELPKHQETHREFLTIEEVRAMAAADCKDRGLKRAFLFSCLTGLRYSDVKALRWCDVRQQGKFTRIVYRQKKTQKQEYLDLSPQAVQYMGERGRDNEPVFRFKHINDNLLNWARTAGINKHITFHSGRHTFAVMMLDLGVDIYTVSKMLGHKDIKTTQIYAELLDKRKQEAVLRIPEI